MNLEKLDEMIRKRRQYMKLFERKRGKMIKKRKNN